MSREAALEEVAVKAQVLIDNLLGPPSVMSAHTPWAKALKAALDNLNATK